MPESTRHLPMITRFYRRLRRDRNLFHRPTHHRTAPPPQKIRFCGQFSAVPRDRSRGRACTGAVIRGRGGVMAAACVCPPPPLSVSAEVRPEDIADLSAEVSADLSSDPSTDLSAHVSADLSTDLSAHISANLSAEAVRLDFCGVNHVELLPRIHMFRGARVSAA